MKPQYSPAKHPEGYRLRYTDTQTNVSGIAHSLIPDQILQTRDGLESRFSWVFERNIKGIWEVLESHGPDLKTLLAKP